MKYLKIQNNGELDIRLVALMGGTTKANDKFKIGQFGTGLKYTLAFLYRNNLDFAIFSGANRVDISTEKEEIRGEEFEIICINGQRTSITTKMGNEWHPWMIIRELWCNALDEGGEERRTVTETSLIGEEGKTTFYIQISSEFQEVLDNWGKYFIQYEEPIWDSPNYAIYHNRNKEKLCLYKNGVLIYQHPNTESLFRYDVKAAQINELREFKGILHYEILRALEKPNQEVISYFLNNVDEKHFEGSELDYDWFHTFTSIWRDTIGEQRIIGKESWGSSSGVDIDYTNVLKLPQKVYTALTKQFEGVGVLASSDDNADFYEAEFAELKEKTDRCIAMLQEAGYNICEGGKIKRGFFENKSKRIAANRSKKWLMISDASIAITDEELCALIVEYNEYIQIKCSTESRDYSKHFVSIYTKRLLQGIELPQTT